MAAKGGKDLVCLEGPIPHLEKTFSLVLKTLESNLYTVQFQ